MESRKGIILKAENFSELVEHFATMIKEMKYLSPIEQKTINTFIPKLIEIESMAKDYQKEVKKMGSFTYPMKREILKENVEINIKEFNQMKSVIPDLVSLSSILSTIETEVSNLD